MDLMGSSPPKTVSRPKDMSARPKYSGGPKRRAKLASAGAKHISRATAIVPAIQDPMAAEESAAPARPLRAIWYPSRQVMTVEDSPGMLMRTDVIVPPYATP